MFCIMVPAGFPCPVEAGSPEHSLRPWRKMSECKSNDHDLRKAIGGLIEQDVSRAEIGRRFGISCYRIRRIAATHGLPDARTYAARRRAGRVLNERQARMLAFIRDYSTANSYPPSERSPKDATSAAPRWSTTTSGIWRSTTT